MRFFDAHEKHEFSDHYELLDHLPIAVGIVELNGKVRFANKRFAELLKRDQAKMIGVNQSSFHPQADQSKNPFSQHVEALTRGEVISLEAEMVRGDDKIVPVEITANKIVWHDESLMVAAFFPIEKRKEALRLLQDSQQEMTAIFENSQIGILKVDGERKITSCNRAFINIVGANSAKDVIGLSVRQFHVSEDEFVEFGKLY
ncbi:PAS domain-containing protein, partial [Hydrogenovibrio marinus]